MSSVSIDGSAYPALFNGQTTVATAGTAVVLGTSQFIHSVMIRAKLANAGKIYVGGLGVTSSNGLEMNPGDCAIITINNLASVFVNAASNGDGVSYLAS